MSNQTGKFSRTGDKCPISGEWFALEDPSASVSITLNNRMPPYKGRIISWQLKELWLPDFESLNLHNRN